MLYYLANDEQDGKNLVDRFNKLLNFSDDESYTSILKPRLNVENHVIVPFEEEYLTMLNSNEQSKVIKELPNSFTV